jgi:NTE family protein
MTGPLPQKIRAGFLLFLAAAVPAPMPAGEPAPAFAPLRADIPSPEALLSPKEQEAQLVEALWTRLRDIPPERRPKVGLVLGGGGARGLAHIGVLKVLVKERVPVDLVVGTSVGALIGALYASGIPVEEIERMGQEIGWDKLTDLSTARLMKLLLAEQLLSTERMERYIQARIGDRKFVDLPKTFACVAADLRTGEKIVLREGSVALAVRASATVPGLFRPVPYRHRLLVDGGLVDNVPTDVAKSLGADIIIAVNVPADFSKYNVSSVLTVLTQALYIQGGVISQERLNLADVLITPNVDTVTSLELWKSKECMEAGEAAARDSLLELRRTLIAKFFERWLETFPSERAP